MYRLRLKSLALILTLSLLYLAFVPQLTLASASNNQNNPKAAEASAFRHKNAKPVVELTDKRDQHTKQYLNDDGSYTAEVSINSRHYKDKDGKWQDISNKIVPSSEQGFGLRNEANAFETHFANNSAAQYLAKFKLNQTMQLSWGLENASNVSATNDSESVTYPDILPGTDLQYIPLPDGLKENIILKDLNAPNSFQFLLKTVGVTPVLQEDGSITLYKESTGEVAFVLPPAYMIDQNQQVSQNVSLKLMSTNNPNLFKLTVEADQTWLSDPNRAYPVTIDPTVSTINTAKGIDTDGIDTYIAENNTYQYYNLTYMTTGLDSSLGRTRSFLKFNLPALPAGAIVTDGAVSVSKYTTTSSPSEDLDAYRVTSDWSASSISWNNQPNVDKNNAITKISVNPVAGSYIGYVNYNIWSIIKGWYNGGLPNYGVMLSHGLIDTAAEQDPLFFYYTSNYGTKTPLLSFTYITDPIGLNPYWSYANTSVGSVNTFNGNLLTSVTDFSLPGRGIPINITRTYNSRGSLDGLFGQKWFSNLDMQLQFPSWGVVLIDSAGTERPFMLKSDGQTYLAPDNYPMQLYKMPDGTYAVQEANTETGLFTSMLPYVTFDSSGKLKELNDGKGNKTTVSFSTNSVVITDPSGRSATLTRSADGTVSQVTTSVEPGKVKAAYTYENGFLKTVAYDNSPDGTATVGYGWANGFLTSLTDKKGTPTYINYNDSNQVISTGPVNLLSNPSLEASSGTDLDNWTEVVDPQDAGSVQQYLEDPSLKKYGRYGLKITSAYKAGSTGWSYLYASQQVPVTPGTQYTFSSDIRTNALNGRAFITIQQIRADGSFISWHDTRSSALTGTTGWTKRNLTVTADPAAAYFIVYLETDHDPSQFGGEAYFDGAQLEVGPNSTDFQGHTDFRYGTDADYHSAWISSPSGELMVYKANNYGNPAKIIQDPRDATKPVAETQLAWDAQDRLRSLTTPNQVNANSGKSYTYQYDALGNLTSAKDPIPGRETKMDYYYNRLQTLTQADGANVQNVWDPVNLNNNTSINQTLNAKAYAYNTSGSVTTESNLLGVADNRIDNSDFTRFDANYQPYNWSAYIPSGATNRVVYDGSAPFGGSNVLQIYPGGNSAAWTSADLIDLATVGSKDTFTVSADIRSVSQAGANADGGAAIDIHWYDINKNEITPLSRVIQNVRDPQWQRYIAAVESPTNAYYAIISLVSFGQYESYFDNVQFEKSNMARGYNEVENSSFERGTARWTASDGYATVNYDPAAYSGSYDAQISLPLASRSYLESQTTIPVTDTNQYYTVTGFITTAGVSSSGGGAWLHVYFYDASGSSINDYHSIAVTGSTPWTKYVMAFKPPANTASMRVRAEMYNASGAAKFDNIRLSPGNLTTGLAYDAGNNFVAGVTDPLQNTAALENNAYGQVTKATAPGGEINNYGYDGQQRLRTVTDNAGNVTTYVLDGNGNVTDVSLAAGSTTYDKSTFVYDQNGNLKTETDTNNNSTGFAYDEGGRLLSRTNPDGTTVSTGYDFYGNLSGLALSGGPSYAFGYDLEGHRTSAAITNGSSSNSFGYGYDEVGNLTSYLEKDSGGNVVAKVDSPSGGQMYSSLDQLLGFNLTYGTGSPIPYTFTYNKAELAQSLTADGKSFSFNYDEGNNLVSKINPDTTQDQYAYNDANQIISSRSVDTSNLSKWSSKYSYDKDGRLIKITGTGPGNPSADFVYNNGTEMLNRVTQATMTDGGATPLTFNYSYDPAGNILGLDTANGTNTPNHLNLAYDADNRIQSINGDTNAVSYDANGNLTKLTLNGKTYLYVYDAANRLTQVKDGAGAVIASYTYDGDGLRLTKTVNGITTTYHYFQGELMYETVSSDPANVIHALYLRSPSGKLQGVKLYNPGSGTYNYYYYHYNAQGDVIAVTDSNGAVYRQYVYDPYGNLISVKDGGGTTLDINNDTGFNNAYTYKGYRYDAESGLYFLNSRYYAAGIGRFLTKDTFKGIDKNPMSLNRYVYAEGDSVNLTDPSGHVAVAGDGVGEKPYSAYREATGKNYSLTGNSTSVSGGTTNSAHSKAYDVAKTYVAPASRIVTALGASTALIGSIVAAPGLVPLGLILGGVGIGLAITLYATGVDTSKLHLAEAFLGAVPLTRAVTIGGVAIGRGLSIVSRADIGAGFVKQAGTALDSARALQLFDGALSFGIGASSLKW